MENKEIRGKVFTAGYQYLLAYKITVAIYDLTVQFTKNYIQRFSRTKDQMEQAARSGMQNIAEGYTQQGKKGYIKLTGIARGSLEELLQDYYAYARQQKIPIWPKEKIGEIREIGVIWDIIKATSTLPDHPNFPDLPNSPKNTVNLMITLCHQANYLLDKLIISIKAKHEHEGGLTEELYWKRKKYREEH